MVVESLENNSRNLEKLILRKEFKIKKLSMNEMRLLTRKRLIPNTLYRIELTSANNEKIKPTAEVLSSFFTGIQHIKDNAFPVYEVILKFTRMDKGLLAGYVLPVTLVYILLIKLGIEKKKYFSTRNFFLPPVIIVSRFF